ncbi:hypothetical protein ACIHCQ_34935 [Streptomyces sp. NPDC052236]|uniref:hypothetical protein n=1 Tax=Streptomyces sp. NPDC052236 TaxID=3365686 RepID=UPI0037D11583
MATDLELFADYFQIHVLDDESEGDLSDVWTEQTVLDGLGVAEDALQAWPAPHSRPLISKRWEQPKASSASWPAPCADQDA